MITITVSVPRKVMVGSRLEEFKKAGRKILRYQDEKYIRNIKDKAGSALPEYIYNCMFQAYMHGSEKIKVEDQGVIYRGTFK